MSEYDVAIQKVLPYIRSTLKWPPNLITDYGRVPVQAGRSTYWADFVCYYVKRRRLYPYLTIEVKRAGEDLDQTVPQAESYSLSLGSPFFCVTDGNKFLYFLSGRFIGNSVRLSDLIPLPDKELLPMNNSLAELVDLPAPVDLMVDGFFAELDKHGDFLKDTRWHTQALEYWHSNIFEDLRNLEAPELSAAITKYTIRSRNTHLLSSYAISNFGHFKKVLTSIKEISGDPLPLIEELIDPKGNLHLKGASIFLFLNCSPQPSLRSLAFFMMILGQFLVNWD